MLRKNKKISKNEQKRQQKELPDFQVIPFVAIVNKGFFANENNLKAYANNTK